MMDSHKYLEVIIQNRIEVNAGHFFVYLFAILSLTTFLSVLNGTVVIFNLQSELDFNAIGLRHIFHAKLIQDTLEQLLLILVKVALCFFLQHGQNFDRML
jgi:hypothetical protein